MTVAALTLTRTGHNFHRVRRPVERLVQQILNECRDVEAQALLNLLESHQQQRASLTTYHDSLQRALKSADHAQAAA
ncbi:MAG: hypothetical protein B7Y36_08370 [Novosphingobium sp. 28-62-57]|uniref:hypothetical protein n=1 Tax=unclassified Novosphingobium TaxID=2644732 RepID=UPI000BDC6AFD|nr:MULTISPECIES: hypothetical protein [unclassified Novosphingobium]OYW47938.1 MAG: hypothetical protein B7Z36_01460 [Novosphingobium sp. 12-63-9]OYZ10831.1 MAG: hypothetical protein B7Y36_08370 [Novosphingobium sp. 28-62-57]OZA32844.1 MAG: hypothetical protein B7X92_12080 [Novosphingobium sp. 17-62-9]HQS70021.1 hypothetical protein [Novosphingobium sp.]